MARYDYIPHGYKVIGEYLVNIETGKVWKTDKTIEELEGKVAETVEIESPKGPVTPEAVIVPKVQAKKVTKAIKRS